MKVRNALIGAGIVLGALTVRHLVRTYVAILERQILWDELDPQELAELLGILETLEEYWWLFGLRRPVR